MDDESTRQTAPRFAFLGFCDRAETITQGHHVFWHENIIGRSYSRVFYVLPVNLRGQMAMCAIYQPRVGDEFRLIFRCADVEKEFEIKYTISSLQTQWRKDAIAVEQAELTEGADGWLVSTGPVGVDVFVYDPGVYKVYLASGLEETFIGEVGISNLVVPPFSAEEAAAIRSNPLGSKIVRMQFKCKLCAESFRVYAGLDRDHKLEAEGWIWNLDIQHDRFRCECGTNDFSLLALKGGLHGMLRQNFNKLSEGVAGSTFSSVRLYEDTALQESCRQFRQLLDSDPVEESVQKFLEAHEIFFSMFLPQKLMLKKPVLARHFVDFAILNERKELLLIEIERPGLRLLRKDGGITAELQHAFGQVHDWFRAFEDFRPAALDAFGLKLDDVARVRGIVIGGRTPTDEAEVRLLRSWKWNDIEFYTHDDLLRSVTGLVRHVANL